MDFTPINTQEEYQQKFNQDLGDRLRKNEEKWQKKYEGLISPEDAASQKSELEGRITELEAALKDANEKAAGLDKTVAEKDAKIKGYEVNALKTKIAHEQGLSLDAVGFLSGEDEDGIKASAEALKGLIGAKTVPEFNNDNKVSGDSAKEAFRAMARSLTAGNAN